MAVAARRFALLSTGLLCLLAGVGTSEAAASAETITGTIESGHGDDFKSSKARPFVNLVTGRGSKQRRYALSFRGKRARAFARRAAGNPQAVASLGVRVRVTARRGTRLRVSRVTERVRAKRVRAAGVGGAASLRAVTGNRKVAVLLLNFRDRTQSWDKGQVRQGVFDGPDSAGAYYRELTNGALNLTGADGNQSGDVYGPYTVDFDASPCKFNDWIKAAKARAAQDGVNLDSYNNLIFMVPHADDCEFGGIAGVLQNWSVINGAQQDGGVVTHELGHNFGLGHAKGLRCKNSSGQPVPHDDRCTTDEYGDPFDVMGASFNQLNSAHREVVGVLSGAREVMSTDGTRTLAPLTPNGSGLQSLWIPRTLDPYGNAETYYQLEYRQPFGHFDAFDPTAPVVNGVTVHFSEDYIPGSKRATYLIDTNPATETFNDAPLPVGGTFTDPLSTVSIKTTAANAAGATVQVSGTSDPPVNNAAYLRVEGSKIVYTPRGSGFYDQGGHDIKITRNGSDLYVDDLNRFVQTGPGCVLLSSGYAKCSLSGISSFEVFSGDSNDNITFAPDIDISTLVEAGAGDDTIVGGAGNDDIRGGAGKDTIIGNGGQNKLYGGEPNDDPASDPGDGSEDDTLTGGPLADTIDGRAGNDTIAGGDGADTLAGGSGDDRIDPGLGSDSIDGGSGVDGVDYGSRSAAVVMTLDDVANDGQGGELDNVKSSVENVTGGAGNDTVTGSAVANRIEGGAGNDLLHGGAGSDVLDGGEGADRMYGDAGTDTVSYASRTTSVTVTLNGTSNDGASGERDNAQIDIENVVGGSGNDSLTGNGNPNLLDGGSGGGDTLSGLAGVDTADYSSRSVGLTLDNDGVADDGAGGEADNIKADVEHLIGGAGSDTIRGGSGSDILEGGPGGSDFYVGNGGADSLPGGSGFDTVSYENLTASQSANVSLDGVANDGVSGEGDNVGAGIDAIVGGAGNDTLVGYNPAAGTGQASVAGGAGNDTLVARRGNADGGAGNDVITTVDGKVAQFITGGTGNDTINLADDGSVYINAGDDNDTIKMGALTTGLLIEGGAGDDTVDYTKYSVPVTVDLRVAGAGRPQHVENVTGSEFDDDLTGTDGPNTLVGGAGNDAIKALGGDDVLTGNDGNDALTAGDGNDLAIGLLGNDTYSGGEGNDNLLDEFLAKGDGNDTIVGDGGDDNIQGGVGNDVILGLQGNDSMNGGDGNDTIFDELWGVGGGNDTITGGNGTDRLYGQSGSDRLYARDLAPGGWVYWSDTVDCGDGPDSAQYNTQAYADVVTGCETTLP